MASWEARRLGWAFFTRTGGHKAHFSSWKNMNKHNLSASLWLFGLADINLASAPGNTFHKDSFNSRQQL